MSNAAGILCRLKELDPDTQLAITPELSLSGYTCQDLFYETLLQKNCIRALEWLCEEMPEDLALVVGLPVCVNNHLYNAAAFLFNHQVLGFYAKTYLPGYDEYYEPRWFTSSRWLPDHAAVRVQGKEVPISSSILFHDQATDAVIGIEICEDLWVSIPVSSEHACAGANILVNCSASNEGIGKAEYRKDLVLSQSARNYAAYIYASAGPEESSSDLVFGGMDLIAEDGKLLALSSLQDPKPFIKAQIDLEILKNERMKHQTTFQRKPCPTPSSNMKAIRFLR